MFWFQGKHTALLKNTHTEQLTKLQHKNQQELDLLEDLRYARSL